MSAILQKGAVDALNAAKANLAIETWVHNPSRNRVKVVVLVSSLESCHRTGVRVSYDLLNKVNEKGRMAQFIELISKSRDPQAFVNYLMSC